MGETQASVVEGTTTIWTNGKFQPGPAGITGAAKDGSAIVVSTGSGTYNFVVQK